MLTAVEHLGHATPDQVYAEVRRHSSAINLSTIYRTLELLDELGLIRHAHIEERTPTYHSTAGHEHFHLVCHRCRNVISLDGARIERFRRELADEHGFQVDVGHLTIFGTCAGVRRARRPGNPATTPTVRTDVDPRPRSPLLDLPDAVDGEGADAGVAAHYGSFNGEQRTLAGGHGFVDLSHRGVVRVEGPDRLTWLHSLTTEQLEGLTPGEPVITLVLSPQGHVEHALTAWTMHRLHGHVEPVGPRTSSRGWNWMRFLMRVDVTDVTADLAVAWRRPGGRACRAHPGGRACQDPRQVDLVPRDQLAVAEAAGLAAGPGPTRRSGSRAASRGSDTTRTIDHPNEVGWVGPVRTPRCIWTRAATAARRRSPACTRSAGCGDG